MVFQGMHTQINRDTAMHEYFSVKNTKRKCEKYFYFPNLIKCVNPFNVFWKQTNVVNMNVSRIGYQNKMSHIILTILI